LTTHKIKGETGTVISHSHETGEPHPRPTSPSTLSLSSVQAFGNGRALLALLDGEVVPVGPLASLVHDGLNVRGQVAGEPGEARAERKCQRSG
jgi:hypothetical protein